MSMLGLQIKVTKTVLGVAGLLALPSCLTDTVGADLGVDEDGDVAAEHELWPCSLDAALEGASDRRVASDEEAWCIVRHGHAMRLQIVFLITPELWSGDAWLLVVDIDDIEHGGTGTYPASVGIDLGDHAWETHHCEVDVTAHEWMGDHEEVGWFLVAGQGRCSGPPRRSDSDAGKISIRTFDFEAGVTWDD